MMKECKICKVEFDEKYVKCTSCRIKHRAHVRAYWAKDRDIRNARRRRKNAERPIAYVKKKCVTCDKKFIVRKRYTQRYCDKACRPKYTLNHYYKTRKLAPKTEKKCGFCGDSFYEDKRRKYCDNECSKGAANATMIASTLLRKKQGWQGQEGMHGDKVLKVKEKSVRRQVKEINYQNIR